MPIDRQSRPDALVVASLNRLEPGVCATVREVRAADEDSLRLKAMGVCNGRMVSVVRDGDPLILRVLGSRIGLSARLARRVLVETTPDHFRADDRR